MSSLMDNAIDHVLNRARGGGIDLDVLAVERKSTAISFQKREMDQFSVSETRQVGVRVLDGQGEGVAYTESLDKASLDRMLDDARANAGMIRREWVSSLSDGGATAGLDGLYNPALDSVPMEHKISAARDIEAAALDFDPRITSVAYSRYGDMSAQVWMANSRGLRGTYKTNATFAYAYCLAHDEGGNVMAGEAESRRDFSALNPVAVARTAAAKTLHRLGASRPETGLYTVVFENRVAERLIGMIAGYFSAKAVDEQTSPLAGKLGQRLLSPRLNLTDDPFDIRAEGSRPFDDEGFTSQKTVLVEDGVIRAFLTNSVLAKKLRLPHTASAARAPSTDLDVGASNLVVRPGTHSFESLCAADSRVIVITGILGAAGFRATSGDFSLPVEGQLYENGRPTRPLKDFLISGNILQLLGAVEAVGQDVRDPVDNCISPSLLVRGVNISGQDK